MYHRNGLWQQYMAAEVNFRPQSLKNDENIKYALNDLRFRPVFSAHRRYLLPFKALPTTHHPALC